MTPWNDADDEQDVDVEENLSAEEAPAVLASIALAKGVGLETFWPEALELFAFGLAILSLAAVRARKRPKAATWKCSGADRNSAISAGVAEMFSRRSMTSRRRCSSSSSRCSSEVYRPARRARSSPSISVSPRKPRVTTVPRALRSPRDDSDTARTGLAENRIAE